MYIVQGDHGIPIPFKVQKISASENIEGATVEVAIHRGEDVFTKAATIINAAKGECEFVLTSSDLTLFATYEWQWTAYFPDGRIFSGKTRKFSVSERLIAGSAGGETVPVIVPFARVEELEELQKQLSDLQEEVRLLKEGGGVTPPTPDTTAPVLTITSGGTFTGTKSVTMSANETADIYYTVDGTTPTTSSTKYTSPLSISATTVLKAFAKDTAGNESVVQTVTYTLDTTPPADTTAPDNVTNLTYSNLAQTSLTLNWTASASSDVASYDIYNGATLLANVTGTTYGVSGLTASTQYTFSVKAKDAANNVASGASVTVTTSAPEDTMAPVLTITPAATFTDTQTVVMSVNETATIYYTLDDTDPKTSGTKLQYTGPLTLTATDTIKAYAVDSANNASAVQTVTYTKQTVISVTGVTLDKSIVSIEQGTTSQLTATISPSNAENKNVSWSSSDTNVATVSQTGLVTSVGVGSVTITATTQDGGKTASCSLTVTQVIVGFDYNNLIAYPDSSTVTFDQAVTTSGGGGAGDWVHPSVMYFDNGWQGHKYWMGVSPYPDTQGQYENTYFFYSDDGDTWKTPTGVTGTIFPLQAGMNNNSDPNLFMDYDGLTMHVLNRAVYSTKPANVTTSTASIIEISSTVDGKTFTQRQTIVDSAVIGYDIVAPSVEKYNGKYYMFAQRTDNLAVMCVFEATTPNGTWTKINEISTGTLGQLWHCEVRYLNQEFIVIGSSNGINGGNLMLGKFLDPMDSTVVGRNNYFITAPNISGAPWTYSIYKSSLVVKSNDDIEVFIGFKGAALGATTDWRVSRVKANRLPQTLNLSPYTQVNSYADNSAFSLTPGKSSQMDYFKYAVDFTITDVLTSKIYAFGDQTNQNLKLYITSGVLKAELWRPLLKSTPVGTTVTKDISYGISVNDRVTLMQDDSNISIYINGRLVHQFNNNPVQLDNMGAYFGDINSIVSMKDIKTYKLPQHFYSETVANDYKATVLSEYAATPSNFWLYDEYNRANGTLAGNSDNGVAYEILGNPQISSNTLVPGVQTTNAALVPGSGNMQILTRATATSISNGFALYLSFTDFNNYVKIEYKDSNISFKVNNAGTTTTTTFKYNISYRNWRFDILTGVMNFYADGLLVGKVNVPTTTFNPKIGVGGNGYTSAAVDYMVVKKLA